ncbi:MAG: FAD-dependent oxidoreductase [Acidobacteria bacterium]|nr:FAD-dependent oxidoreductase [Acidobacteriota bacterium]
MKDYDVIIIGGGPAGMSALIWCHSTGLRGIMLEKSPELGGQMLQMYHRILDYPGLMTENGREMRDHFLAHLNELQLSWKTGCVINQLDLSELGIPGESKFKTSGVSFSATRDHSHYAGRNVVVIGGGDSAVENALILARVCPRVTLIHRSGNFRARDEWIKEARENPRIEFLEGYIPMAIEGTDRVERILLKSMRTGAETHLETSGVFIKIGIAHIPKSLETWSKWTQTVTSSQTGVREPLSIWSMPPAMSAHPPV